METANEIKEVVKAKYNKIAEEHTSCCGDTSCYSIKESYDEIEVPGQVYSPTSKSEIEDFARKRTERLRGKRKSSYSDTTITLHR